MIDIGSNSVRLVVFDGAARSPAYFYNEKIMCGLGRDLAQTGKLHPEGRARALAAMHRFALLQDEMEFSTLKAVATAAVRDASDGPDFIREVQAETGIEVAVASGEDEARLAAQGVLLGWPMADGLVSDLGGGSMEIARLDAGEIVHAVTTPLGPLRLMGLSPKARRKMIADHLKSVRRDLPEPVSRLYLVGGSWRALAKVDMERRLYPLRVLHEYSMTAKDAGATAALIEQMSQETLAEKYKVSSTRLPLVPYAAEILTQMVRYLEPKEIAVSSYGLREGLLFSHMPEAVKQLDPLLEAARYSEQTTARAPGFGAALYKWVKPVLPKRLKERARIVRAACLLHDTSWRAHPDYRAEICFENATRANLGGLSHEDRVFLGLALLHRYKSNARMLDAFPALSLLEAGDALDAEYLGRLMRLGSMLTGGSTAALQRTRLQIRDGELSLRVAKDVAPLISEMAEKRLAAAAGSLGMTWVISFEAG